MLHSVLTMFLHLLLAKSTTMLSANDTRGSNSMNSERLAFVEVEVVSRQTNAVDVQLIAFRRRLHCRVVRDYSFNAEYSWFVTTSRSYRRSTLH